jgi:hypothetical protein
MVEYHAAKINYELRSTDPDAWFSVGFSLHLAATVLWKRLRPIFRKLRRPETKLTEREEMNLRLQGPFAMLSGMAIEAMLKGAIVRANRPKMRRAPPAHHDLVKLSAEAKQDWNSAQVDLLRRLTTFILWGGRYPVATTSERTKAPRILKSSDYAAVTEIVSRVHKDIGVIQDQHLTR